MRIKIGGGTIECRSIPSFMGALQATDGSKIEDGVDARIYCPELAIRLSLKLLDYCNICQAEIFTIG